jgi:hypothetical protein
MIARSGSVSRRFLAGRRLLWVVNFLLSFFIRARFGRQMQNGLTFTGVLIASVGWMLLLLGASLDSLLELPGVSSPFASGLFVSRFPVIESAAAAILGGLMLAGTGLWFGTRERPTKRRHPRRPLTPEVFHVKIVIRTELQTDGRTKYYYEGGETEIY